MEHKSLPENYNYTPHPPYEEAKSNDEREEETAFDWFNRSRSNTPIISPFIEVTDDFLSRRRRCRIVEKIKLQEGTGVRFIDEILRASNRNGSGINNNVVLEISGTSGSGKTALAITLAASYVAATSFSDDYVTRSGDYLNMTNSATTDHVETIASSSSSPQVIIIDSEYGMHVCNLSSAVRAAIIRRWQIRQQSDDHIGLNNGQKEESEIERYITEALGRIHMTHPRDYGIGFVSTFEVIKHALDGQSPPSCPVMIIIDSIGSFEQRERMLEETRSGLSGRGDFIRQLRRLLRGHRNVIVIATRPVNFQSVYYQDDAWNKLVTHRVSLERAKGGTVEDREGFEFVSFLKDCNIVVPFSVTSSGVLC